MIDNKKVLAMIPARSGSKGIIGKNIKKIGGKPLIAWPIEAAKSSKYIDKIIVSTDTDEIANVALSYGAEIPFLRPSYLAQDKSTTYSVIQNIISYYKELNETYDYFVLLEPTSPLTTFKDVDDAILELHKSKENADSIVGVSKLESFHPKFSVNINKQGLIEQFMGDFGESVRRQDLDDLYFREGSLYISKIDALIREKSFYHSKTLPYIVPKWKSFEVDDMVDFICIEAIMKAINNNKIF